MQIAIIGSGRMGRALAELFSTAGHQVRIGSRDPAAATGDAIPGVPILTHKGALEGAELAYLATPYRPGDYPGAELVPLLSGKVVVEMANPLDWRNNMARLIPADTSTGEELAARVPGARVVSTMKTINPTLIALGNPCDLLLSGDDEGAKEMVVRSLEGTPFRGLDAGPLETARMQEQMVPVLVRIGKKHKAFALRIV